MPSKTMWNVLFLVTVIGLISRFPSCLSESQQIELESGGGGSVIDDVADDVAMIKKRSLTGSQPEFVVECYGFRCLKFRKRTMAAAVPTPLPTPPPTCSAFDPNQMNEAYNRHQEMTTQLDNPTTAAPHHERYVAPPFMFASADMNRKQLLARRPPGKFFP